jgi:tRNA dimethylallyltransferase
MEKTLVILGPTASGKTDFSLELYQKYPEFSIVNCDSRQFWPITKLSCSPSAHIKAEAPHYLFNCLAGDVKPSLGWWAREISKINKKIIVGGNGFYIQNLKNGIPIVEISEDIKNYVRSLDKPFEYLNKLTTKHSINCNDTYRILRLLEFFLQTGRTFDEYNDRYQESLYIIGLFPSNEKLLENIKNRTDKMIDEYIEEIMIIEYHVAHHNNYNSIIGYREILDYLHKKIDKDELINMINHMTYKYAKHQMKFFKRIACDEVYSME